MQSSLALLEFNMDAGAADVVGGDKGRAGEVESEPDDARGANDSGPEGDDQYSVVFPAELERRGLSTCEAAGDRLSGSSSGTQRT